MGVQSTVMGRITNFHGQMQTQISFCVESQETGHGGRIIRSYSSDVPEYLIILFGVSWMSDTANALHDADHEKDEKLLRENQTLEEFFTNIYNFLNGDM